MTAREQYKYAQRGLRSNALHNRLRPIPYGYSYHDYILKCLKDVRCDILMKAWQTL